MLNVQRLLRSEKTLADLTAEFGIRVAVHPELPLVILNYDQIESKPKAHPVVVECRGLVLERGTWDVVARAFPRFFNWGEQPDDDPLFDWSKAVCQEKCDGSLALVYWYGGKVFVNTRGSFAQGPVQKGHPLTWGELFWSALAHPTPDAARASVREWLVPGVTLVFELCSPYNRVVRRYAAPVAYLLSAFRNATGEEVGAGICDGLAVAVGARRPLTYHVNRHADMAALLAAESDPTFEGFVLHDGRVRKKVKSSRYVALHHIRGEGDTLFSPKTLVPFILNDGGNEEELLLHLGQVVEYYAAMKRAVHTLRDEVFDLWGRHHEIVDQKEFALAVKGCPGSMFLFEARKKKCHPRDVWAERAEPFLVRWLDGGGAKLPPVPLVAIPDNLRPCQSDGDVVVTDWNTNMPVIQ